MIGPEGAAAPSRLELRACLAGLLGLPWVVGSTSAEAAPTARLVYSRTAETASCPAESELRHAVAARFGYDPFSPWAKQTVLVQISRQRVRFIARVQLLDDHGITHGARELSSDERDCSEIFDALALAITIALDAASKSDPPSESPEAPSAAPAPSLLAPAPANAVVDSTPPADLAPTATPGPSAEAPVSAPPARSTPRLHVDVGVDALASLGVVPSASPGVSAFARGRVESWSLSVEIRADLPESAARSAALGGGGVESWLAATSLAPCFHAGYVVACASGTFGSLQASGRDIDPRFSKAAPFVAAGVRLGVEWPESTMYALRVHFDGMANLLRARLVLGQSDEVWAAPPFAGTLGAGMVVRFP